MLIQDAIKKLITPEENEALFWQMTPTSLFKTSSKIYAFDFPRHSSRFICRARKIGARGNMQDYRRNNDRRRFGANIFKILCWQVKKHLNVSRETFIIVIQKI